jgi:hypothetical protein
VPHPAYIIFERLTEGLPKKKENKNCGVGGGNRYKSTDPVDLRHEG